MRAIPADRTLQLGGDITKGLGAGANPDVGRNAAIEDRDAIVDVLTGTDMVFTQPAWWWNWDRRCTSGCGDGTHLGILTVAIVTRPFGFEGVDARNG